MPDSSHNMDYILGKTFPPATVYGGYAILAGGLYGMTANLGLGALFALVGVFIAFSKNGMRLDPAAKAYQSYTKILGIRFGKWISLEKYKETCLLKTSLSSKAYSRTMQETETSRDTYYNVYLLNKNHLQKLLIARFRLYEEAEREAHHIAQSLDMPFVSFQPQISKSTRMRRTRR